MSRRTSSSQRWLRRQARDPYVARAQAEGLRSRAAYKLAEIDEKEQLLRPGQCVVDLGAAPGGWSQYVARRLGGRGSIFALDLLAMDAIAGVEVLCGDFTEQRVLDELVENLAGQRLDLVISDMAPNMSGWRAVDQPRAMALAELALDFAARMLRPGGHIVVKVFHGEGFEEFVRDARARFQRVRIRKPDASRADSREVYLVGRDFRPDDAPEPA